MDIKISLDKDFEMNYDALQREFGSDMARLNGFSDAQLSYTDFIDNFVDKQTVADASVDGNANVGHKDIVSLENEMSKPHSKLLAFNKIFYELKKTYGYRTAVEWLRNEWDGHFYLHDAYNTTMKPYCYAYDLEKLVNEGLYFIDNFNAKAPQHLTTFTDFVAEFISYCCNRSSGAVGLPSFLVYSFYFWKKDCENQYLIMSPEYYRDQSFQEIIYRLNQPFLRSGVQSSFTNFSIFDRPYLEALFGGKEYPDGTFIIDYVDDIIEYQKAFMRVVSEVRSQCMMTFPVLTYALLRKDGEFIDEEFAKWCCLHNMKWGDSNFFISDDVTSLSNCCLHGDEYVLTKSDAGIRYCPIRDVVCGRHDDYRKNMSVYHNGSWVRAKPIKLAYRDLMYRITTANGKSTTVTGNHLIPTLRGDVRADQLTNADYIMFNTMTLDSYVNRDNNLSYEQGYVIGAYAGDGSIEGTRVTFSLSDVKVEEMLNTLRRGVAMIDADCTLSETSYDDSRLVSVSCGSEKLVAFIRKYLSGGYANTKAFEACSLYENREFRKGIIDGWYATDGGNSNRIYSTSEMLIRTGDMICTSIGMNTTMAVDDSRVGEVAFVDGDKEYCHNYPVWCLRYYENTNRRHLNDVYVVRNNSVFFKIQSINTFDNNEEYVYCFEIDDKYEPYFTLPNGMITHNCRLRSDIKDLGYFNSLGNVALEVGSVKVNTINLARLSYECDTTEEYLETLKEKAILCLKVLERVRHIIRRNVEKGLLPNYSLQLMDMSKQYNTIGIIGLYEALQKYGFIVKDEFGNVSYTDGGIEFAQDIMDVLNETKNEFTKDAGYMANIEQIPGERAASILMQKDKMLFPDEAYDLPLYGNQWIPLGIKTTLHEKVRISAILDNACNGGSIAHINLDAPIYDFDTAWKLLNYVADEGVQYFAFNLRISACKHNHGFYGNTCPECGEPVETTYQRIVGFLVPTKTYSAERKAEFAMRDWFTIGDDL